MRVSCICISLYFGRIISPVAGFSFSIFLLMFISHFGNVTFPVFWLYSTKLCWQRFVRISCRLFSGISSFLASFFMFSDFCSSIIVRRSAAVDSICLNLSSQLLRVRKFLSV